MTKGGARFFLATSLLALAAAAQGNELVTYSYDALGRLTKVSRSGSVNNPVTADYGYDAADNRTNVTVTGGPVVAGGSFEAPDVGSAYAYAPVGGPATFTGNSGVAGNGSPWGFAAAPDGDQVAFVQSYGTASTITLQVSGLTPGTSYTARFWIAARPGYGANPVTVAYNGVGFGTFTPGSAAFAAVTSAPFTASAATGTLTITGSASAADLGTGLDRVSVAVAGGQ